MDITEELPTVIAFCAGYGGIERGLDLAGVEHRVIAFLEIEAFAIANLVNKMEDGIIPPAPIYTDLKTFPAEIFRDRVDIITGGYPCQPFSSAGKRLGADDPRHLWPHIRRHIKSIRPVRCFFENVEGHISLGLSSVISDLEEDGYRTTWGIFSAREVGAPHQRKRVYIMGDTKSGRWRGGSKHTESQGAEDYKERPKQDLRSKTQRSSKMLADKHSQRQLQPQVHEQNERGWAGDCCKELGDSNSIGLEEHGHIKSTNALKASQNLADSDSASWQGGRIPSGVHKEYSIAYGSGNGFRTEAAQQWLLEPKLGRVVDGCSNRVDRLRLLGNGVVPQTAAKAWVILSERFN